MNNHKNSTSPAPTSRFEPRPVKLPSFNEALQTFAERRNFNWFWFNSGHFAQALVLLRLLVGFHNIILSRGSSYTFLVEVIPFITMGTVCIVNLGSLFYLGMISHLLPTKPVGVYKKHASELVALLAAVIWQCLKGYDAWDLLFFSALIFVFHALCHLVCHPPDLSCRDWFLEALMQVAVYGCGSHKYAIVATTVACVMVIYNRFCSYSCP